MIDPEYFEKLDRSFDPGMTAVAQGTPVPHIWQGYMSESKTERLFEVRQELAKIADYFPHTADALSKIIIDAFLINSPTYGLCRIFVRQLNDSVYYCFSRAPTKEHEAPRMPSWDHYVAAAPDALVWVHQNVMDGLTDIYAFGGFLGSGHIQSMAELRGVYAELPWHEPFVQDHDPSKVLQVFSSGGGGYLLIDLNEDLSTRFEPQAMLVDVKVDRDESLRYVDLFSYLDTWMAIALAEATFDE